MPSSCADTTFSEIKNMVFTNYGAKSSDETLSAGRLISLSTTTLVDSQSLVSEPSHFPRDRSSFESSLQQEKAELSWHPLLAGTPKLENNQHVIKDSSLLPRNVADPSIPSLYGPYLTLVEGKKGSAMDVKHNGIPRTSPQKVVLLPSASVSFSRPVADATGRSNRRGRLS
jgi:hypothetical protein